MSDIADHPIRDVEVGPDDPATDVSVETLRSGLAHENDSVRLVAANVASFVPPEDGHKLKAVRSELVDLLDADRNVEVHQAIIALKVLSMEHPEALEDAVPEIVGVLDHQHSMVRAIAGTTLATVAMERPALVADEVETLAAVAADDPEQAVGKDEIENEELDRAQRESLKAIEYEESKRKQMARDVAANLLVEVAEYDHTLVTPHLDELLPALRNGPEPVKLALADTVRAIAEADSDAASEAVDALIDALDAQHESVVATAVTALGFIGDEDAVDALRELATDESRADELRELAEETADFVAA